MSIAEIKAELPKLSPPELAEVEAALQQLKHLSPSVPAGGKPSDFFGSMKGTVIFLPGWNEPEPAETWHAMRDDLPL